MPACGWCFDRALRRLLPCLPLHRQVNPAAMRSSASRAKTVFAVLLLSFAGTAHAHSTVKGVGDLYAGLLHVLTALEHVLPFIALSLLAGQRGMKAHAEAVL